jgi:hypothetical protein
LNPPPLPVWAFATTASVAGVAVVGAGAAAFVWASAQASYKQLGEQARASVVPGSDVTARESDMLTAETVMWTLVGAGAATTAAAAAMIPFVDFQGYADAASAPAQ